MSDSTASPTAAKSKNSNKPPLTRRLFALFLVLLFAAIGGSIVLYAKKTGYDGLLSSSAPPTAIVDVAQSAKTAPKPLPSSADTGEMVVVDDSVTRQPNTETPSMDNPPGDTASGNPSDVENLKLQLKNMEIDFAQKTGNMKSAAEMAGTISSLQKEVLSLTEKVNQLEQLTVQLQESSKRGVQNDVALLLAVNNLQMAIASGRPFSQSMGMLKKLADGNADMEKIITSLQSVAENGIADLPSLQREFAKIAHQMMQAQAEQNAADWAASWAGEGMIAGTIGKIASLVTLRRTGTGEQSESDLESNIAAIETDLSQNRLFAALDVAKSLPAHVRTEDLDNWQYKLTEKNTAETALAELQKMILTRLQSGAVVN